MDRKIEELAARFTEICENRDTYGLGWKNLKLVPEAFEMMQSLPLDYDEEVNPDNRITVLQSLMGCVNETDIPRFSLKVREYQLSLFKEAKECETSREDVEKAAQKLRDYLNPAVSMEEWCRKYHRTLKFDDVERSQAWEDNIYEVEKECWKKLEDTPKGMGFCFEFWSAKTSALAKRGIEWRNPHIMNPRVMFD